MTDELFSQVIVNVPNFLGFVLAVFLMYRANVHLVQQNNRLIDAIIKKENCEDTKTPSITN